MPGFCTNCGAPLTSAFCTRCGQRAPSPTSQQPAATPPPAPAPVQNASATPAQPAAGVPAPSQPAASSPPSGPAQPAVAQAQPPASNQPTSATPAQPVGGTIKKSSGAGKVLLIIGGILLVFCLAAFGAVWYGLHWVKQKASSLTGGASGEMRQVSQGHACSLLSTQELQQVLGVTVERSSEIMEGNEPGCAYYTSPAAFTELQKIALEQAKRDSEKASKDPALNNSKNDNPLALLKHTEEMEGIVKGLGMSQPDQQGKVFSFTVDRNFGAENWGTLRTTMSVVPGFKEVDGVGDRAMIGSFGHTFLVLKGNSMIRLETMYVPETRVRGAELGRKIVSHL